MLSFKYVQLKLDMNPCFINLTLEITQELGVESSRNITNKFIIESIAVLIPFYYNCSIPDYS